MRFTYTAAAFVVLAGTWLVWSGHTDPLLLGFGLFSCLLVLWLTARMHILDEESQFYATAIRSIAYLPWLAKEIAKSNVAVARLILSREPALASQLIRVEPDQRSAVGQVIFANSITLTPGTVTLDMRDRRLLVHALTDAAAYDLTQGEMNRRVRRLEGHPADDSRADDSRADESRDDDTGARDPLEPSA